MPIITISRASRSKGEWIATQVAETLGIPCLAKEIITETADDFCIPHEKIYTAVYDGPTLYERILPEKQCHLAMIKATLLKRLAHGDFIYHGPGGHVLLDDVPHTLKVRIISRFKNRLHEEMERSGLPQKISRAHLTQKDKNRVHWNHYICKADPTDTALYSLALNLEALHVEGCVSVICETFGLNLFNPNALETYRQTINDMALTTRVKATLMPHFPDTHVTSHAGRLFIMIHHPTNNTNKIREEAISLIGDTPGIRSMQCDVHDKNIPRTAMHK